MLPHLSLFLSLISYFGFSVSFLSICSFFHLLFFPKHLQGLTRYITINSLVLDLQVFLSNGNNLYIVMWFRVSVFIFLLFSELIKIYIFIFVIQIHAPPTLSLSFALFLSLFLSLSVTLSLSSIFPFFSISSFLLPPLSPSPTLSSYFSFFSLSSQSAHFLPSILVFANGPGNLGSIPGRVIQKTLKMVLDTSLLSPQKYKVRIKGKMEQSKQRSSALLYTSVLLLLKREASDRPRQQSPTLLYLFPS